MVGVHSCDPPTEIWNQKIGIRFRNLHFSQACKAHTGGPWTTRGDVLGVSLWGVGCECPGWKSLLCGWRECPSPQHTLKTLGRKHHPFTSVEVPYFIWWNAALFFAEKLELSRDGQLSKILQLIRVGYPQPNHTPWASQQTLEWSFGQRQDTTKWAFPQIRQGCLYLSMRGLKILGIRQFRMVERCYFNSIL